MCKLSVELNQCKLFAERVHRKIKLLLMIVTCLLLRAEIGVGVEGHHN